jgi:hypothetical protein
MPTTRLTSSKGCRAFRVRSGEGPDRLRLEVWGTITSIWHPQLALLAAVGDHLRWRSGSFTSFYADPVGSKYSMWR